MIRSEAPLANRFLLKLLILYTSFAVIITSAHLYFEFERSQRDLIADFEGYKHAFENALSAELFNLYYPGLDNILEGILKIPEIDAIEIIGENGKVVRSINKQFIHPSDYRQAFDLNYKTQNGKVHRVGKAIFYSSKTHIWDRIQYTLYFIVFNAMLKTLLLWYLARETIKNVIGHPLSKLIDDIRQFQPDSLIKKLPTPTTPYNEIILLHHAFQNLKIRLSEAQQKVLQTVEELREVYHKEHRISEKNNLRLSSLLHDEILQHLGFIYREYAGHPVLKPIRECEVQIRKMIQKIFPFEIKELGLTTSLKLLLQGFQKQTDIVIQSSIHELPEMSHELSLFLYRFIQECLSNAIKHSQSYKIEVIVLCTKKGIFLQIEDDGIGFDPNLYYSGFGMKILRQQSILMNAELDVSSTLGEGTSIALLINKEEYEQKNISVR